MAQPNNGGATGRQAAKLARKRNRFLALLRKYPGLSRQDCARAMAISAFNASRLATELLDEGLVLEEDAPDARPDGGQGRPPRPLRLNGDYQYFAGIDLEAERWRFTVVDFAGVPVLEREADFVPQPDRAGHVAAIERLLRADVAAAAAWWPRVAALGIGLPGLADYDTGIVRDYAPLPHFAMIPLRDIGAMVTGKPVHVVNNIACLAVHDLWRRGGAEQEVVFHAAVRSGIGSVLTHHGRIFRGSHRQAGELGHFRVVPPGDSAARPLQEIAGLTALRRHLRDVPAGFWRGDPAAVDAVLAQSAKRRVLEAATTCLGRTLADVAMLLDPDRLIVHSPLLGRANALWQRLEAAFTASLNPIFAEHVRLAPSGVPSTAAAVGAALYALECVHRTSLDDSALTSSLALPSGIDETTARRLAPPCAGGEDE